MAGVTILGLLLTVSFISARILLDGVNRLEAKWVETNTQRVNEAIRSQLEYFRTKTADWAYWDDSYNFILTHDPTYVSTNLVPVSFVNMKVDSIIYLDNKNRTVYAKSYDPETQSTSTVSANLIEDARQINNQLLAAPMGTDVTGLILLPEGPTYISARQILHSDNTGPAVGILLFSESIDKEEIKRLASVTKTQLEAYRLDEPMPPSDQHMVQVLKSKPFALMDLSGTQVAGFTMQKDVNSKNIMLLDVIQSRDYYTEGVRDVKILLVGFGAVGLVFLIIVLIALERFVLSPLVRLRVDVDRISESGDLRERLTDEGSNDEFGVLTRDLNKMLQSLEYSQRLLKTERERSKTYVNVVGVIMITLSPSGTVTFINKRASEVLEVSQTDAMGKNWFDTFIPENERAKMKDIFAHVLQTKTDEYILHENEVITKSGKLRLIPWRNVVIRNESGVVIEVLSSGEDITDTKESREKAFAHAQELEQLNQMMVGRELKMTELKSQISAKEKEISELKAKLGITS